MGHAVYVIKSEAGPVKIGMSSRPLDRLVELQKTSAAELRLVHSLTPDGVSAFAVERAVHEMLSTFRLYGEWFNVDADRAIAAVKEATDLLRRPKIKIADPPQSMLVEDYLAAIKCLGLTPAGKATAEALGLSLRQCQRIAAGESPVPEPVAILLRLLVKRR